MAAQKRLRAIAISDELLDDRRVSVARLMLALSATGIVYVAASVPGHQASAIGRILVAYTIYSFILWLLSLRRKARLRRGAGVIYWIDIIWCTTLIALSDNHSFFLGFYFLPIFLISSRQGLAFGLLSVTASTLLFFVVGYASAPPELPFEVNHFLMRLMYLVILGYMIVQWGDSYFTLKHRMALLQEVISLANPRVGEERLIGSIIERLRTYYEANLCVLILFRQVKTEYSLYRSVPPITADTSHSPFFSLEWEKSLLALPDGYALITRPRRFWPWASNCHTIDVVNSHMVLKKKDAGEAISELLAGKSLITTPLYDQHRLAGRVFLATPANKPLRFDEIGFLQQVFHQVLPVLERTRLTDKLATKAAEEERQRLARDIHDTVIQPYLGLQIGLTTVHRNLTAGVATHAENHEELSATVKRMISRLEQLIEMTDLGVMDLRRYVKGLRSKPRQEESLIASIQRFAAVFDEATGIRVEVSIAPELPVDDRLLSEVFQMVVEGLSNIRRHTHSGRAWIRLTKEQLNLILRIENERDPETGAEKFTPRSITERAQSLRGNVIIEQAERRTVVIVTLPM